ncbi:helix-turn-helix transcriptional regulator [Spirosoma montaniterrae]|uniref:HTH luxR-type domain-containing protein n=1 Tax=Spirosoma montaniterrae TaxID=1178516 RepID=A0A1P9WYL7_9BACT|nr:LuxR C-terminal-related transcriptional regulator [Spirosoma montaniterrae]AQG80472.1 hypothetical protein AWR27_14760 [Spirosoma montaniterrae]
MEDVVDKQVGNQLIERLFPGWVVLHCFNGGHSHRFISGNGAALFGHSNHELNTKKLADLLALVHPDDREPYSRIRQKIDAYAHEIDPAEIHLYRFVVHYRIRRGQGNYFCLHDEKQFYVNRQGNLEKLVLFRDLSAERPFVRVQLDVYKVHPLGYRKISTYVPTQAEQPLTSREVEIIELIKEGLSSKEIATRLFISINTVRNHRSNLFRKTNARNMVDLLNSVPA